MRSASLILSLLLLAGCATAQPSTNPSEQQPNVDSCAGGCQAVKALTAGLVFVPLLMTAPGEAGNASALAVDIVNIGTNSRNTLRAYDRPEYDTEPTYYEDPR